ncbi:hypothetical protein [Coxiella endosymbiont of Ornithodoros maritimus]|uniref:hypothetical protein n=1 Tax=Coxiella endosymbiont of Ornithodoros maritimus TaxID=1656172 RepID=UPI0022653978|nr:hypothetical protein [Coxiella endosymbiont of Ornithodoros maritimus]
MIYDIFYLPVSPFLLLALENIISILVRKKVLSLTNSWLNRTQREYNDQKKLGKS